MIVLCFTSPTSISNWKILLGTLYLYNFYNFIHNYCNSSGIANPCL
jgi:hypothetical protein